MKLSKYTFLFDTENKEYYAYNSLSNALIEIDADSYLFLQKSRCLVISYIQNYVTNM